MIERNYYCDTSTESILKYQTLIHTKFVCHVMIYETSKLVRTHNSCDITIVKFRINTFGRAKRYYSNLCTFLHTICSITESRTPSQRKHRKSQDSPPLKPSRRHVELPAVFPDQPRNSRQPHKLRRRAGQ